MIDKFKEECGVMAVWNHEEAANICYLGLYALQHRGQEGVGVVSKDASEFYINKGVGLVSDNFSNFDFSKLPGNAALGHVRYSTAGDQNIANVQPIVSEVGFGPVALAHNGNLVNAESIKAELICKGALFSSNSDSEVILHLISRSPNTLPAVESLISALTEVKGAYSLVVLFRDRIFAMRDPQGFRPLSLGQLGTGFVFASETCAFDLIGATFIRDLEPGEIVEIAGNDQPKSYFPFAKAKQSSCIFEHIYFARPDSKVFGENVYAVRTRLGQELAKEHPVNADVVIPVPDSGVPAALGFAEASGIPFQLGLIRNHYIGRTFIEPKQAIRDFGVKIKHNPNREVIFGKKVVLVDDSLVRGTTSKKLVKMIRQAGAKEVHLRISSPPITDSCYYGIDTPKKEALLANNKSIGEIKDYLQVDSICYLSREGLLKAANDNKEKYCDACFTGNYPVQIGSSDNKDDSQLKFF